MTLISLLLALLLEQVQPVRETSVLRDWLNNQLRRVRLMAAPDQSGPVWAAWYLVVAGAAVLSLLLVWLLGMVHPILELLATAAILYLTLGFRRFSHWYSEIQASLARGDLESARQTLAQWVDQSKAGLPAQVASQRGDESAVARESIRLGMTAAQQHVFGVIFWFVILPGPSGAVAYWLSALLLRSWSSPRNELSRLADQPDVEAMAGDMGNIADDAHGRISSQAFRWVDWMPVRVTAAIFAVVGNFEDAIGLWRSRVIAAPESTDDTERVLIASGSGAMGIELGLPDAPSGAEGLDDVEGAFAVSSSAGPSLREPDGSAMASAIGLVWRAVLVWFFMVLLFSLGRWLA